MDYFKATLPPALFFIWTVGMGEMTPETWRTLVGTAAEWLFLGAGRYMLTVKGVSGGEKALPSSFAMSAAAFGRAKSVIYLQVSPPLARRAATHERPSSAPCHGHGRLLVVNEDPCCACFLASG